MGDVLKNDESVKFYTGFPSLTCLMTLFSLIKPFCSNLKYWDSNKLSDVGYQKDSTINKPGRKRTFSPFEEFILTLVRLRLGLLTNLLRIYLEFLQLLSARRLEHGFVFWARF